MATWQWAIFWTLVSIPLVLNVRRLIRGQRQT
jgi:hypothetical protein